MPSGGVVRILLSSVLFVLTGLVQTVSIQAVLYSGGGDRSTFLLALPNYIGIVFVSFFGARAFRLLDNIGVWATSGNELSRVHLAIYTKNPKHHAQLSFFARLFHPDRRKLFILAFNELGGFLTGLTGLSIAGSGLYQVVFSGATVFTAILTTAFLRKRLSFGQWFSVALITFGLMITAEQVTRTPVSTADSDSGAASVISGLAFVLVSCLFYSTNYVIAEYVLNPHNQSTEDDENALSTPSLPPPSGLDLSLYTGGSCLMFFTVYVLVHTIPNWHQLVTSSIEKHHGNTTLIMEYYIYLFCASFIHAVTHYDVVATVGAVPIGVLNALRAVSVFAASSWLFCSHQASQCFNSRKGISTAIVIGGALAYSVASTTLGKKKPIATRGSPVSVKSLREESRPQRLALMGRKLKKAVSTYIGFAPHASNVSTAHNSSSNASSQSSGTSSKSLLPGSTTPVQSSSNPEGWSSSIKKTNPGNG